MANVRQRTVLNETIIENLKEWAKTNGTSFSAVFVKLQTFFLNASEEKQQQIILYNLKLTSQNKACNIYFGEQGLKDYRTIKGNTRNNVIINKLCAWFLSLSEEEKNRVLYL